MPVSPSDPPVCPTWRCTGEETTHFSRAQIQPAPPQGLRCARAQGGSVSTESHWLLGGFGQWSHSVETRGREKRRIRGLFLPLSAALDSSFRRAAPTWGILALAGQAATRWPRPKHGNTNSSVHSRPAPQGWQHLPAVNRLITGSANMPPSASHLFHQETYRVPVLFQRNERKVCLGQRTPEALRPASPKPLSPLGEVSGEGRGYSCSQTHHGKESSSWPSSPTAHCWKHGHEERTQ